MQKSGYMFSIRHANSGRGSKLLGFPTANMEISVATQSADAGMPASVQPFRRVCC